MFDADGAFLTKWGSYGSREGQFIYPYGIATDAAGDVYVADTANARIQKFTASGVFLGSWGGHGRGPGRFFTPTSVATDPAGFVYVADAGEPYPDSGGARVQKFTAAGEFVAEWGDIPRAAPGPTAPLRHGWTTDREALRHLPLQLPPGRRPLPVPAERRARPGQAAPLARLLLAETLRPAPPRPQALPPASAGGLREKRRGRAAPG